jgi:hypothetical protein
MPSGNKELVWNTLERALSVDNNRAQKFRNADTAELLRYMLDVTGDDDVNGGVITEHIAVEAPMRGEIINGLLVKPQVGSLSLLVDPGVLYALSPDAAADDSAYKFVHDPGIGVLGTLNMTAGAGAVRIDVIEIQVGQINSETDNRDIFNPVTGLFTAASVTKAQQGTVTQGGNIRVRAGAPGGGFPGVVSGWLPLAVASVPISAASNDVITFWDVRPLVRHRILQPFAAGLTLPNLSRAHIVADPSTSPGSTLISGLVEASSAAHGVAGNYRLGGTLRRGTPGSDVAGSFDAQDVANQGGALGATVFYFVYLCQPFGLPRWERYTDAPAARIPRNPRGIPVVSTVSPDHYAGTPSAPITLPTSCGFGAATTSDAVCIFASTLNGGVPDGGSSDGRVSYPKFRVGPIAMTSSSAGSSPTVTFTLIDGTTHPPNAKALYVQLTAFIDLAGNPSTWDNGQITIELPGNFQIANVQGSQPGTSPEPPATILVASGVIRIPIAFSYPALAGTTKILVWTPGTFLPGPVVAPTLGKLWVVGWELGP